MAKETDAIALSVSVRSRYSAGVILRRWASVGKGNDARHRAGMDGLTELDAGGQAASHP